MPYPHKARAFSIQSFFSFSQPFLKKYLHKHETAKPTRNYQYMALLFCHTDTLETEKKTRSMHINAVHAGVMTSSFKKIRYNKRDNFFKVKDTLQRERYLIWCLSYFCNTPWLWDIGPRLLHTVAGIEDWNMFSKSATKGCSFGFFYLLLGLVKGCILCDNI